MQLNWKKRKTSQKPDWILSVSLSEYKMNYFIFQFFKDFDLLSLIELDTPLNNFFDLYIPMIIKKSVFGR